MENYNYIKKMSMEDIEDSYYTKMQWLAAAEHDFLTASGCIYSEYDCNDAELLADIRHARGFCDAVENLGLIR